MLEEDDFLEEDDSQNDITDDFIDEVLNHYRTESGKKMRTRMLISMLDKRGGAQGFLPEEAFSKANLAAAAIEMLHTATLIHDDILDDATHRRGLASLNAKFGRNVALVAGDVMLSRALARISSLNDGYLVAQMLKTLRVMCDGQLRESAWKEVASTPERAEVINVLKQKSGSLFGLAARFGVYFSIANPTRADFEDLDDAARAGELYGIAFQLRDDLRDLEEDKASGVPTFPLLFGEADTWETIEKLEEKSALA
jgi:heptaprenyl diphosphate synthase